VDVRPLCEHHPDEVRSDKAEAAAHDPDAAAYWCSSPHDTERRPFCDEERTFAT
jgi:hypothetical protein